MPGGQRQQCQWHQLFEKKHTFQMCKTIYKLDDSRQAFNVSPQHICMNFPCVTCFSQRFPTTAFIHHNSRYIKITNSLLYKLSHNLSNTQVISRPLPKSTPVVRNSAPIATGENSIAQAGIRSLTYRPAAVAVACKRSKRERNTSFQVRQDVNK
jgi:hypothetical protein